jgi:hypothetical protein
MASLKYRGHSVGVVPRSGLIVVHCLTPSCWIGLGVHPERSPSRRLVHWQEPIRHLKAQRLELACGVAVLRERTRDQAVFPLKSITNRSDSLRTATSENAARPGRRQRESQAAEWRGVAPRPTFQGHSAPYRRRPPTSTNGTLLEPWPSPATPPPHEKTPLSRGFFAWGGRDSNPRPSGYEPADLAVCGQPSRRVRSRVRSTRSTGTGRRQPQWSLHHRNRHPKAKSRASGHPQPSPASSQLLIGATGSEPRIAIGGAGHSLGLERIFDAPGNRVDRLGVAADRV